MLLIYSTGFSQRVSVHHTWYRGVEIPPEYFTIHHSRYHCVMVLQSTSQYTTAGNIVLQSTSQSTTAGNIVSWYFRVLHNAPQLVRCDSVFYGISQYTTACIVNIVVLQENCIASKCSKALSCSLEYAAPQRCISICQSIYLFIFYYFYFAQPLYIYTTN